MRLLLLTLIAILAMPAAAQQLYRWKDDNGVVHYTDQAPTDREFETRNVVNDPPAPVEAPVAEQDTPPSGRCLQARANLQVFESSDDVSMDLDGDGVPERLDAVAHARELERTRELVQVHCTD
jgi:hypothetical protein